MFFANQLNERFGRKLFSEQLDLCGLPLDGWALPLFQAKDDPDQPRMKVSAGTFRQGAHERLERVEQTEFVSQRDLAANPELLKVVLDRLLVQLVDSLPEG